MWAKASGSSVWALKQAAFGDVFFMQRWDPQVRWEHYSNSWATTKWQLSYLLCHAINLKWLWYHAGHWWIPGRSLSSVTLKPVKRSIKSLGSMPCYFSSKPPFVGESGLYRLGLSHFLALLLHFLIWLFGFLGWNWRKKGSLNFS